MSKFEFHLGTGAILLAILLAVLGTFTANATGPVGRVFGKAVDRSSQADTAGPAESSAQEGRR